MTIHVPEPTTPDADLTVLSDPDLVAEIARLAARERHATAAVLRVLIEFDRRCLYLAEGYSSLFAYCTQVLHYSEHGAFNRIEVARAAARWPQLLDCLEDGSLHLAGARLLAPHLTEENLEFALAEARYKSKREIEEVAAGLARRSLLVAVAPQKYRLHVTISRETRDRLRQVQALLSHQVPDVNEAIIVEQAVAVLLEKLERQRLAATPRPRRQPAAPTASRSRHIPAAVRRDVWKRDEGRCAFVGHQGRCGARHRLEFHHVTPFAAGGKHTATNIELRCRAHNVYEAEVFDTSSAERRTPKVDSRGRAFDTPPIVGTEAVAAARGRAAGIGPPDATAGPSPDSSRDESTLSNAAVTGSA